MAVNEIWKVVNTKTFYKRGLSGLQGGANSAMSEQDRHSDEICKSEEANEQL